MITAAVAAATAADNECAAAIGRTVSANEAHMTPEDAQEIQQNNVRAALQEMRDTIPKDATPEEVSRWWSNLAPKQQTNLEKACPVEIYRLTGIPDADKQRIDRPDQGFSSTKAVKWALEHKDDTSIDVYENNCANFVSNALHEAGLPYKINPWKGARYDSGGWGQTPAGELNLPWGEGWDHTKSWGFAPAQKDFFLDHGGATVTPDQARPGDVVYWEYTQAGTTPDGNTMSPGLAHHAAIVTGVLPDGQVVYTQHTPGNTDLPLDGRLPEVAMHEGQQKIEIVTPKKTW